MIITFAIYVYIAGIFGAIKFANIMCDINDKYRPRSYIFDRFIDLGATITTLPLFSFIFISLLFNI